MKMKRTLALSIALGLLSVAAFPVSGSLNGQKLFESKCSTCHETKIVLKMKKTKKGWKVSVDEMRQNGAQLSNDEAAAIVGYLVKTAGR